MRVSHNRRISRTRKNLSATKDDESTHRNRYAKRSASVGMSCKPLSCLITRLGNTRVLPKWLRRRSPMIPRHPVIIGPPGFQLAAHKNFVGVSSSKNCLHSDKLRSGGRNIRSSACWGSQNLTAVLKKVQSMGDSAVRTRMWTLVGARMRAFGSRGLTMSTFLRMHDGHA
ncbi:hypothetical protein CRG98_028504 [Punica granatum]|uniref:Uncharacterized protein n=1 Tax=Punica granatum TaxID=22663 RepID=A0A2I0J4C6_PUNGR|nr:hypothetical protein CRG98_028504 [Punica granatum]